MPSSSSQRQQQQQEEEEEEGGGKVDWNTRTTRSHTASSLPLVQPPTSSSSSGGGNHLGLQIQVDLAAATEPGPSGGDMSALTAPSSSSSSSSARQTKNGRFPPRKGMMSVGDRAESPMGMGVSPLFSNNSSPRFFADNNNDPLSGSGRSTPTGQAGGGFGDNNDEVYPQLGAGLGALKLNRGMSMSSGSADTGPGGYLEPVQEGEGGLSVAAAESSSPSNHGAGRGGGATAATTQRRESWPKRKTLIMAVTRVEKVMMP
jgi:hypothetical protein